MEEPRIQHYVPVVNLNGFTTVDNKIFVYDKATDNVIESRVENIPFKYSINDSGTLTPDYFEKQYTENTNFSIESEIAPFLSDFIQKISSCERYHISDEEKDVISTFLALQIERSTTIHEVLMKLPRTSNRNHIDGGISDDQLKEMGFDFRNFDPDELFHDRHAKGENKRENFSKKIKDFIWFIVVNETDIPFYTSDNPVVMKDNYANTYVLNTGNTSKGIGIIYPLNSKYLLAIRENGFFIDNEMFENNMLHCSKEDGVRFYNALEIMNSHRHVYSSDKEFKIVAEIKNKYAKHFGYTFW